MEDNSSHFFHHDKQLNVSENQNIFEFAVESNIFFMSLHGVSILTGCEHTSLRNLSCLKVHIEFLANSV